MEDVDKFVEANFDASQQKAYRGKGHPRHLNRVWPSWCRRARFVEYFQWYTDNESKFEALFLEHNCPVFIGEGAGWRKEKIVWNACLKEVEFFRKFDAFTTFQEIAMYFGGLAVPLKPIPKISDRIMIEAKGFDGKTSFRKAPGKKK